MIDFTNLPKKKKSYAGANGSKLSIIYNDELYMLKLPCHAYKNKNISYSNSCITEHIACEIFNMLGVESQKTILGRYKYNDIERIAVACKDFETDGYVLKDFASVKNQIIDSETNGYGTSITEILETINAQTLVDPKILSDYFWDMFVIDTIIGNMDRHNGNWGFLYNQTTDDIKIAPIYDCGSSLYPQIDDDLIKKALNDEEELNIRIYDFPTSALCKDGKRINYYQFIKSHEYKELDKAISRISKRFDMDKINNLIVDFIHIKSFRYS